MSDHQSGEFLPPGTKVEWTQRLSGDHKVGVVVRGFHGIHGPSYLCRARGWAEGWTTAVLAGDLRLAEGRAAYFGSSERPS